MNVRVRVYRGNEGCRDKEWRGRASRRALPGQKRKIANVFNGLAGLSRNPEGQIRRHRIGSDRLEGGFVELNHKIFFFTLFLESCFYA
jgi:hypothetical protein